MGLVILGRQIHTEETLVSQLSALEAEVTTEKLKRCKSPGTDQILAETVKAGGRTIYFDFHKCINSIWNKEELPEERKELIIVSIYKKDDKTDCSN